MFNFSPRPSGAVTVLVCALSASAAFASPQSDRLTEDGVGLLEAGDAAGALERFNAAARADGNDPQAAFFQGAALNRLGRPADAAAALQRAVQLRTANPDIDFELGWALLNTGRIDAAIERLERYEAQHPGRGQAAEFLGRAYLAKGDLDRAESMLHEALSRDPQLNPTVALSLMTIDERRGDYDRAVRRSESVQSEFDDAVPSRVLRNLIRGQQRVAAAPTIPGGKPWRIVLGLGFGYTDNVVAASDDIPLPTDISGTDSAAGRFSTLFSYDLITEDRYRLQAGYAFSADEYEGQFDTADYKSHLWYLDYVRRLSDKVSLNFRVSDEYLNIGGSSLRNAVTVRPAVTFAIEPELAVELSYTFVTADYYFPTAAVTDRDGTSHTLAATAYWRLPDTELVGRTGVFLSINETDGADYDNVTAGGFIGVSHPLVFEIDGSLIYSRINGSFEHANSFTGFAFKRDDDIDVLSAELSRPIDMPWLEEQSARVYLRYDYTENDSNVPVFNYDQYTISAGVVIEF